MKLFGLLDNGIVFLKDEEGTVHITTVSFLSRLAETENLEDLYEEISREYHGKRIQYRKKINGNTKADH